MERFAENLLKHRWATLFLLVVLSALLAYQLRFFSVRSSMDEGLPENDPSVRFFKKFLDIYENPDLLLIGVKRDDIFCKETLERIEWLTRAVEAVPDVMRVTSITNVPYIRGTREGIEVKPFLEEIPSSSQGLSQVRSLALSNRRYVKNLVSADGTFASINAQLVERPEDETFRYRVVRDVRKIMEEANCFRCYLTGLSVIAEDSLQSILRDLKTYLWMTPVLISMLLCVFFRSLRGFFIPQGAVLLSVIWTMGLFLGFGRSFSMTTTMLPVLISVICLSDVIHILNRYYEESQRCEDRDSVLKRTVVHMMWPCFITSATTAIGFGSLVMNDIKQIREFGIFSFVGILCVYVLAITLTPILLSFLPLPNPAIQQRYSFGFLSRILQNVENIVENHRKETLAAAGLVTLLAVAGIFQIRIETHTSKFLPAESPSIQGLRAFGENLSGIITVEVVLEGAPGVFKEPSALVELDRAQHYLEEMEGVQKTHSVVELIKEVHQTLHAGDPAFYSVPDRRDLVAQYLFLLEVTGGEDLISRFLKDDFSSARLSARVGSMSTRGYRKLVENIQQYVDARLPPTLNGRCTGTVVLYATLVDALTRGQIRSLGIAFLVITLFMTIYMRSYRIGLISMIPNLFPVVLILGLMGWTGITLNIVTIMISSIALGISVDDTIHYLSRYRSEWEKSGDVLQSMRRTMLHTGRAIVSTSVVMTGGFWVLCLSEFRPNIYLGFITGVAMIAALLGDLLLLPICVQVFGIRK